MSTLKSISELKQGDKVSYYGAIMLVTKDTTVYIAKCKLIDEGHSNSIDILKDYDYFQGTKEVNLLTV